jgi:glyoxylase-like metal-dependent hydrolase (beta-lactamase superfamily II)
MKVMTVLCVLILAACTTSTPDQQFGADAVRAVGGRDRVTAVTMLVLEGRGTTANLGQDMTWEAATQAFDLSNVRRVADLSRARVRTTQTRTPNFLYFQGPQPQQQIVGVDGDIAYSLAPNGNANRQSDAVAKDRRAEFYHHPLPLVRALLDPATRVANVQTQPDSPSADVTIGETTFNVTLDRNGLPARVQSPGYHPNLGDVTITTNFADYRQVAGLMLPTRLSTNLDGRTTTELQVERYSFEAPADDLAAPASAASTPSPVPATPKVDAIAVSKGVWLLAGQSHHSALIEFADHLTLIEAPQSEMRARAVMAKARELVPGKPLTELVMSHHHFDHSGGVRAAVAEGLAVITHKGNAEFVEEIIKRPHSRQPDALQRNPKPLTLRTVDDELTLQDAAMTATLYSLDGNPHADTMVMAYIPESRLLIEVDAFSPGGTYHPYAAHLLDSIRRRQLRVDRIVPLHGSVVTLDDLVKAVAAQ